MLYSEDNSKKVTISVNGKLYEKLSLIAEIKGVSLIEVIETMINEKLMKQTLLS